MSNYRKTSAYISVLPKLVTFAIPYSDSGDIFQAIFSRGVHDILIKQDGVSIIIPHDKLEEVIKTLKDIKELVEFEKDSKETEN